METNNENSRRNYLKYLIGAGVVVIAAGIGIYSLGTNKETTITETQTGTQIQKILSGTLEIDGSSTVYPITEAVAEDFNKIHSNVRVNVGVSGTGGGMKRFTVGETDIANASRPIKQKEIDNAKVNGINFIEFSVAIDGLAIIVNKNNDWIDYLTIEELNMIWKPESTVKYWSDIRDSWPNKEIHLYGPGTDSGTFDYFTDVINGEEGASRPDYVASEDDNVLVQGISGDLNSLGYFGYAYYIENKNKLKIVPVDSGKGPITPSHDIINTGKYIPLSRDLLIYVNLDSLKRTEVKEFVLFYMEHAEELVNEVGYTPLNKNIYQRNLEVIESLGQES